jgi:hypothetical protein
LPSVIKLKLRKKSWKARTLQFHSERKRIMQLSS